MKTAMQTIFGKLRREPKADKFEVLAGRVAETHKPWKESLTTERVFEMPNAETRTDGWYDKFDAWYDKVHENRGTCGSGHCDNADCLSEAWEAALEAEYEGSEDIAERKGANVPVELPTGQHQCRHKVSAIGGDLPGDASQFVAYVGWDRALNTFFLQVGYPGDDGEIDGEDRDMHWVGTSWGEIPTVDALAKHMQNETDGDKHIGAPWAELSVPMGEHLETYQRAMPAGRQPRGFVNGGMFL